jgi:putative DNA primase/helicase
MRDNVEAARGRWREILPALGIPSEFLNGKNQPCPICGGKDRARFHDRNGEGVYFCNQCGAGSGFQLLQRFHGWDFKRAVDEVNQIIGNLPARAAKVVKLKPGTSSAELNRMWMAAKLLTSDDPVGLYLNSRGIRPVEQIMPLRFATIMHYPTNAMMPAIIARMCDAQGNPKQIHRTYLTEDGRKADVQPNRMFMPGDLPKGGAIRLGPVAVEMGIAEGIETALSAAMLYGMPVWATTSSAMLEQWVPPEEVRHLIVFGDVDVNFTGQASAYVLARRLARDHPLLLVDVMLPRNHGRKADWNDVLMKAMEPNNAIA